MAETVVRHMRSCMCKTQTATTGARPPLVAASSSTKLMASLINEKNFRRVKRKTGAFLAAKISTSFCSSTKAPQFFSKNITTFDFMSTVGRNESSTNYFFKQTMVNLNNWVLLITY